jgi:hypothetical protein
VVVLASISSYPLCSHLMNSVAIQDSDSEDELAIGGHELGTNLEDVDVEMSLS